MARRRDVRAVVSGFLAILLAGGWRGEAVVGHSFSHWNRKFWYRNDAVISLGAYTKFSERLGGLIYGAGLIRGYFEKSWI